MARCPRCEHREIVGASARSGDDREVVIYRCARCGLEESRAQDEEDFMAWDERWNPPDAEVPETD
jgi:DNA-directed RNA polymerase subunit RPC12/RpoP